MTHNVRKDCWHTDFNASYPYLPFRSLAENVGGLVLKDDTSENRLEVQLTLALFVL